MFTRKPILKVLRYLLIGVLVVVAGFPVYWMATTALNVNSQLYGSGQVAWPQTGHFPELFTEPHKSPDRAVAL